MALPPVHLLHQHIHQFMDVLFEIFHRVRAVNKPPLGPTDFFTAFCEDVEFAVGLLDGILIRLWKFRSGSVYLFDRCLIGGAHLVRAGPNKNTVLLMRLNHHTIHTAIPGMPRDPHSWRCSPRMALGSLQAGRKHVDTKRKM